MNRERELLEAYIKADRESKQAEAAAKQARAVKEECMGKLIEFMEDRDLISTGRYDCGHATLSKPRLYASFGKDKVENVFAFLRANALGDIIQPSVNPATLSSVIGGLMDSGIPIPEEINVHLKSGLRVFRKGGD